MTDSPTPGTTPLLIIVTANFNLAATTGFIDPFRAANYLEGTNHYRWTLASVSGGPCMASSGIAVDTRPLADVLGEPFAMVVVSSSWTPEAKHPQLLQVLRRFARQGALLGALDTGAFILAEAGLLKGRRATVHYEHIDALRELHQNITVSEDIFVHDAQGFSCSGGVASVDMALQIIRASKGDALANQAARYIFHAQARPAGTPQNPIGAEPLGGFTPFAVRQAIAEMELRLEDILSVPDLCALIGISQRQLDRLFARHVGKSPTLYYRDIRLDRARGLVTQTDMTMSEIAIASGFSSLVHFSRAYRKRFGLAPRTDRVDGRIPFEFRAWPMHHTTGS